MARSTLPYAGNVNFLRSFENTAIICQKLLAYNSDVSSSNFKCSLTKTVKLARIHVFALQSKNIININFNIMFSDPFLKMSFQKMTKREKIGKLKNPLLGKNHFYLFVLRYILEKGFLLNWLLHELITFNKNGVFKNFLILGFIFAQKFVSIQMKKKINGK